jgi:hypothetical protein
MSRCRRPYLLALGMLFLGTTSLWAADRDQRALPRAIVSGVYGDVRLLQTDGLSERPLRFHESVAVGQQVTVREGAVLELLLRRQGLLTVYGDSILRLAEEPANLLTVQLRSGELGIAAAQADQPVLIQTPSATIRTYGGLFHVIVIPARHAVEGAQLDGGIATRLASMQPVETAELAERIVISEGRASVQSRAMAAPPVTLEAGQGVQFVAGQMKWTEQMASGLPGRDHLPATSQHAVTPARAVQHVAARDLAEAHALQEGLLEATDTLPAERDVRNVILSTSFGVPGGFTGQTGTGAGTGTGATMPAPRTVSPDFTGVIIPTSVGGPANPPQGRTSQPPPQLTIPQLPTVALPHRE